MQVPSRNATLHQSVVYLHEYLSLRCQHEYCDTSDHQTKSDLRHLFSPIAVPRTPCVVVGSRHCRRDAEVEACFAKARLLQPQDKLL